jgi:hypothetical protein
MASDMWISIAIMLIKCKVPGPTSQMVYKKIKKRLGEDPRWQVGYRSRKPNLHDSKTSLRS